MPYDTLHTRPHAFFQHYFKSNNLERLLFLLFVIVFASTLLSVYKVQTDSQRIFVPVRISQSNFQASLEKCIAIMKQRPESIPRMKRHNPRAVPGTKSVLLKNGIILDGVGGVVHGHLLMKNGIIEDFGTEIDEGKADVAIDVRGKFISPGIVDMHRYDFAVWLFGIDSSTTNVVLLLVMLEFTHGLS